MGRSRALKQKVGESWKMRKGRRRDTVSRWTIVRLRRRVEGHRGRCRAWEGQRSRGIRSNSRDAVREGAVFLQDLTGVRTGCHIRDIRRRHRRSRRSLGQETRSLRSRRETENRLTHPCRLVAGVDPAHLPDSWASYLCLPAIRRRGAGLALSPRRRLDPSPLPLQWPSPLGLVPVRAAAVDRRKATCQASP